MGSVNQAGSWLFGTPVLGDLWPRLPIKSRSPLSGQPPSVLPVLSRHVFSAFGTFRGGREPTQERDGKYKNQYKQSQQSKFNHVGSKHAPARDPPRSTLCKGRCFQTRVVSKRIEEVQCEA